MQTTSPERHSNWQHRYFELAGSVAKWSKDPSSKVGCVYIGSNGQVLSSGYNGFPRGIEDSPERLNDRETKYKYVSHAETNGIYNACLNGTSLAGSSLFVYGLPVCSECAKAIIQVGVSKVFLRNEDINDRWLESFKLTQEMFKESGVELIIV